MLIPPVTVRTSSRSEPDALREVAVLVECDTLEPAERSGDRPEPRLSIDAVRRWLADRDDAAADQELAIGALDAAIARASPESGRRRACRNR